MLPWITPPWLAAGATATVGAAAAIMTAAALALVQATADGAHLGRIMSLFALAAVGSQPLGNALTGLVAAVSTVPIALLVDAGLTAAGAVSGLFINGQAGPSRWRSLRASSRAASTRS